MTTRTTRTGEIRRQTTLERTFRASLEDVWELWTTKDGIESWWGPDGFTVTVQKLELHPGGAMVYAMTATGPEQVAFMQRAGMPVSTVTRVTFTEVEPRRRLAFENLADFIPGVQPYAVEVGVDLHTTGEHVRVVLTLDAMHSEEWTTRMVMGWEGQLAKLTKLIEARFGGAR